MNEFLPEVPTPGIPEQALPSRPAFVHLVGRFDTVQVAWGSTQAPGYEVAYGLLAQHPEVVDRQETPHLVSVLRYLLPATAYFVEVRAVNASGQSTPSMKEITTGPDLTQPRNVVNPGRTVSEALLTWDAPQDASYLIDYEITCPGLPPARTAERRYNVTGLSPQVPYVFTLRPRRPDAAPAARAASISVTTHDYAPPTRPQSLRLRALAGGSALLSWGASADNVRVTGYEVRRNGGAWIAVSDTHFTVSGAHPGDILEVQAKDAAGNRSRISVIKNMGDQDAPTRPGLP